MRNNLILCLLLAGSVVCAPPWPTDSPVSTTPVSTNPVSINSVSPDAVPSTLVSISPDVSITTVSTIIDSTFERKLSNDDDLQLNSTDHQNVQKFITSDLDKVENQTKPTPVDLSTDGPKGEVVTEPVSAIGEEDEALVLTLAPGSETNSHVPTQAPTLTAAQREDLIGHLLSLDLQPGDKIGLTPDQRLAVEQELEYRRLGLPDFTDPDPWQKLSREEQSEFNRKFRELSQELQVFSSNQFNTLPESFLEHAFNMFILLDIQTLSKVLERELEDIRAHQLQQQRLVQQQQQEDQGGDDRLQQPRTQEQFLQFLEQPQIQEQFIEQSRIQEEFLEQPRIQEQFHKQPRIQEQFLEQPRTQEQFLIQPRIQEQFHKQPRIQEQFLEQPRTQEQFLKQPRIQEQFLEQPRTQEQFIEQPRIQAKLHEQPRTQEQFFEQPRIQEQASRQDLINKQPRTQEFFAQEQGFEQGTRQEQFPSQNRFSPQISDDTSSFQQKLSSRKSTIDPRLRSQFDPRRRQPAQHQQPKEQQQQVQQLPQQVQQKPQHDQQQNFVPHSFELLQQHFNSQSQNQLNRQSQQQLNSHPRQLNSQQQFDSQQFNSKSHFDSKSQQLKSQQQQQLSSQKQQFTSQPQQGFSTQQFFNQPSKKIQQQEAPKHQLPQRHFAEQERLIAEAIRLQNSLAFPEV
ncbi:putative mediator of RNA polymerase II transcription subunit 12 isoform X2 [Eurytemora carolleeae]|uniref:putative mediator of RNA polymerase II transcription subunit 12 isoform X2 n=1 Tax=Eurytemora carolleeae TaxID=1294199 RepID=UPI000C763D38|nr:putative mediator of RNA polymerase II transcription subunit 12 isoform X2 [Eurytemora carolleeae]|eukprot:XP_023328814.1 putative mediator of RNA polymerase II transcription subunit 12 isoform X2 [Eurytemora affinis]